ncbi:MAG: TraR/DksA C4-type zinc finger protein, partial [Alicyclobacillus shizuokensis]|nr:TraR/DksA C4-type zinc finger protein [Alicyclobacillus shizuokensis]
ENEILEKQYRDLEQGNLLASQSDFSGEMPFEEEYAASGTSTFERERDLSLSENVKDLLQKVNEALERIENGTYGICEMCEEEIAPERLEALPFTRLCVTCQSEIEKEAKLHRRTEEDRTHRRASLVDLDEENS